MCHNQGPALLPQVSGRGGSGPKWCPRWPASRSACCPQSWCTSPPSNLSQPGGPQWTQVPHLWSECSSPEYVASQTPTASSSAVSPEGIETKTDGTYSGNASLLTSFTSSAAMEAVELDARRQTVGLAADFSPSWTSCACAQYPFSPHMLSQCKDSTILTISSQPSRQPPNTGILPDYMFLPVHWATITEPAKCPFSVHWFSCNSISTCSLFVLFVYWFSPVQHLPMEFTSSLFCLFYDFSQIMFLLKSYISLFLLNLIIWWHCVVSKLPQGSNGLGNWMHYCWTVKC